MYMNLKNFSVTKVGNTQEANSVLLSLPQQFSWSPSKITVVKRF